MRLRNALQFSLNIPAIKAGFINGLDHQFERTKDFGLTYPGTAAAGRLREHRHARGPPDRPGRRLRDDRERRRPDAAPHDPQGARRGRQAGLAADGATTKGERVVSSQAAYIITDILAGNTVKTVNPFWAKWQVTDGIGGSKVRPAAYKTGTTSDNRDVHAYGYLAPPTDKKLPALVAGVWMGNSDNTPNDGKLSLDTSAPLWSAILSEVSQGHADRGLQRA